MLEENGAGNAKVMSFVSVKSDEIYLERKWQVKNNDSISHSLQIKFFKKSTTYV